MSTNLENLVSLSITIIGHNEALHLEALLPSLSFAEEIIYVDCESKDDSLKIAEKFGCKTFERSNNRNLNVNKSFAMDQAKGDWIFYLDPDERISEHLIQEVNSTIQSDPSVSAFKLPRKNHYFGYWLQHGSQYPDFQLRLFRRGKAFFPNRHVHEKLQVDGQVGILKNALCHYPYLDISQFLRKFDFYTGVEADYLQEAGVQISPTNHLRFLVLRPISRFVRRYLLKQGFRDGLPGLFCALFDAMNQIVRYLKLWERQSRL